MLYQKVIKATIHLLLLKLKYGWPNEEQLEIPVEWQL